MKALTPDMIDATVFQLRSVMDTVDDIPQKVKASGKVFIDDLDAWSEELKAKQAEEEKSAAASAATPGEGAK